MCKTLSDRLVTVACIALLSACGSTPQKDKSRDVSTLDKLPDSQPSASTETIVPVPVRTPLPAASLGSPTAAATTSAAAPIPAVAAAGSVPGEKTASVRPDRYIVLPGDTLAGIAAKPAIYGDARMWPLLHHANINNIGPQGLIFPNQVLIIDRSYSPAEANALVAKKPSALAGTPAPHGGTTPGAAIPPQAPRQPVSEPRTPPPQPAPASGQGPSLADFLDGARNAFASGDLAWAAYYYSVYLERRSGDHAVWGELGNAYYRDGNLTDAARAFYNAANLLIDRGRTARALDLLPAIQEGDPALGDALLLRLTTVRK